MDIVRLRHADFFRAIFVAEVRDLGIQFIRAHRARLQQENTVRFARDWSLHFTTSGGRMSPHYVELHYG